MCWRLRLWAADTHSPAGSASSAQPRASSRTRSAALLVAAMTGTDGQGLLQKQTDWLHARAAHAAVGLFGLQKALRAGNAVLHAWGD